MTVQTRQEPDHMRPRILTVLYQIQVGQMTVTREELRSWQTVVEISQ